MVAVVVLQEEQHQTETVHLELPTKDMLVVMAILDHQQLLMPVVAVVVLAVLELIQELIRQVELVVLDLELVLLDQTILSEHLDLDPQLVDG